MLSLLLIITTTTLTASNGTCQKKYTTSCTNTNKTTLIPRSHGTNLALEYTNGWQSFMYPSHENLFGSVVQGSFFYEQTTNHDKLGRYFSPTGKNFFTLGARFGDDQTLTQDLDYRSIIQTPRTNSGQSDAATVASICLKAKRDAFGFVLNYHQYLDAIVKNLYIKINVPIVHIEHTMHCSITGKDTVFSGGVGPVGTISKAQQLLQDYFNGDEIRVIDNRPALQDPLICPLIPKKAKKCERTCSPSIEKQKTGIADIDVIFGYYLIKQKNHHIGLNFGFTIPTGNEPDGQYMWETVYGNGAFWGVGFGFSGYSQFLHCGDHALSILGVMNYRYLLEHQVPRKLGLCNKKWSQYLLLGKKGEQTLAPAGNDLVRFLYVTPGSQIDFIVQTDYTWKRLSANIGYNLFYHDKEHLKYKACEPIIAPDSFAFPSKEYVPYTTTKGFGLNENGTQRAADFADPNNPTFLTANDIDLSVAATPSLLSHKIYGGISYTTRMCKSPLLVGIGAHYEFGRCNENLDTWAVNAKIAIAF